MKVHKPVSAGVFLFLRVKVLYDSFKFIGCLCMI